MNHASESIKTHHQGSHPKTKPRTEARVGKKAADVGEHETGQLQGDASRTDILGATRMEASGNNKPNEEISPGSLLEGMDSSSSHGSP